MEKPTLNDGLRMLLSCFRKMMSAVLLLVQLPLLADLLLGGHDVVDVVDGERGHDGVEAPQVRVLGRAEAAGEDLDQELEVLRALGEVLAQVLHDLVNVRVYYTEFPIPSFVRLFCFGSSPALLGQ